VKIADGNGADTQALSAGRVTTAGQRLYAYFKLMSMKPMRRLRGTDGGGAGSGKGNSLW
jgi:hypothetical protein